MKRQTIDATASAHEAYVENSRAYHDDLATRYHQTWDTYPIQMFMNEIEQKWTKDIVAPRSRVLVVGCGGGRELTCLLDLGCAVTAIDMSPEMINSGRDRYAGHDIDWRIADAHDLPAFEQKFDVAIAYGVVNYFRDPALCLRNIRNALVESGLFLFDFINSEHASELRKTRVAQKSGRVPLSVKAIASMLEESEFLLGDQRGIRFFADLLPREWNRPNSKYPDGRAALEELLQVERRLLGALPPEQGYFIWTKATAK